MENSTKKQNEHIENIEQTDHAEETTVKIQA
jgi:hypothetical protein